MKLVDYQHLLSASLKLLTVHELYLPSENGDNNDRNTD